MRYAIVYSSATGNTAALASRLREVLAPENCVYFGPPEMTRLPEAERYYVGFWTDKGTCDGETAGFLSRLPGRELLLFGTAGFGGSQPYFEQILSRIRRSLPEGAVVRSSFMCQGRMGLEVRRRYEAMLRENPRDQKAQMLLENFDQAASHPNEADLDALTAWAEASLR